MRSSKHTIPDLHVLESTACVSETSDVICVHALQVIIQELIPYAYLEAECPTLSRMYMYMYM